MFRKTLAIVFAAVFLGACGLADKASEDINKIKQTAAQISALIQKLKDAQYPEIWVQVKDVSLTDSNNQNQVVYSNPTGKVINVISPASVAELINVKNVPEGSYKQLNVTVGQTVTLVDLNGTKTVKTIPGGDTNGFVALSSTIDLQLLAGKAQALLVQFNLQSLINQATPVIALVTDTAQQALRNAASLEGKVVAINADNSFQFRAEDGDAALHVSLHSLGVIVNETTKQTGQTVNTLLKVGDEVQVVGNYNANKLELVAIAVAVISDHVSHGTSDDVNGKTVEVEGTVNALDTNAGTLTLNIEEASFIPSADPINVINLANAAYSHGNINSITLNGKIEIKGKWDNASKTLTALRVEIEGAPASGSDSGNIAEVEGTVVSLNGNALTINVTDAENITVGATLTTDITNAWFKSGNASCLTSGVEVELKGTVSAGPTLNTTLIEVKSGSCGTLPDSEFEDESDNSESNDDSSNSEES